VRLLYRSAAARLTLPDEYQRLGFGLRCGEEEEEEEEEEGWGYRMGEEKAEFWNMIREITYDLLANLDLTPFSLGNEDLEKFEAGV
jgi:hypothetical protein